MEVIAADFLSLYRGQWNGLGQVSTIRILCTGQYYIWGVLWFREVTGLQTRIGCGICSKPCSSVSIACGATAKIVRRPGQLWRQHPQPPRSFRQELVHRKLFFLRAIPESAVCISDVICTARVRQYRFLWKSCGSHVVHT